MNQDSIIRGFGWKPIGLYDFPVAGPVHAIDPFPLSTRTLKIISVWSDGKIGIRFNEDVVAGHHVYTIHNHGMTADVDRHMHEASSTGDLIKLTTPLPGQTLIETLIHVVTYPFIISHALTYIEAITFRLNEVAGCFNQAGPWTKLEFHNTTGSDMTGKVQMFESVYGF